MSVYPTPKHPQKDITVELTVDLKKKTSLMLLDYKNLNKKSKTMIFFRRNFLKKQVNKNITS